MWLSLGAAFWSFQALRDYDPKNGVLLDRTTIGKIFKYTMYTVISILAMISLFRYRNFMNKYVEKIVYNTEKE